MLHLFGVCLLRDSVIFVNRAIPARVGRNAIKKLSHKFQPNSPLLSNFQPEMKNGQDQHLLVSWICKIFVMNHKYFTNSNILANGIKLAVPLLTEVLDIWWPIIISKPITFGTHSITVKMEIPMASSRNQFSRCVDLHKHYQREVSKCIELESESGRFLLNIKNSNFHLPIAL